jgi:hypothetical protein
MALHVPRLPVSLDPLIAEAKRRMRRRRAFLTVALLSLAGAATAVGVISTRSPAGKNTSLYSANSQNAGAAILTLNCASTTVTSPFPPTAHDREVLGAVLLPLRYQPEQNVTRNSPGKRWPYGVTIFLFIHQRSGAVLATIPRSSKAAMIWGSSPPARTFRFKSCSNIGVGANGWTGGLLLKSRTACVPITFQLGTRRKVVPFWIGRHC